MLNSFPFGILSVQVDLIVARNSPDRAGAGFNINGVSNRSSSRGEGEEFDFHGSGKKNCRAYELNWQVKTNLIKRVLNIWLGSRLCREWHVVIRVGKQLRQ